MSLPVVSWQRLETVEILQLPRCRLYLLLGLAKADILRSYSRGTHGHFLLSQIRDCPNLEGQVPVLRPISYRKRVARLYPQSLHSLFVTSFDSQGYGRGI
jgi:hypothetical protein